MDVTVSRSPPPPSSYRFGMGREEIGGRESCRSALARSTPRSCLAQWVCVRVLMCGTDLTLSMCICGSLGLTMGIFAMVVVVVSRSRVDLYGAECPEQGGRRSKAVCSLCPLVPSPSVRFRSALVAGKQRLCLCTNTWDSPWLRNAVSSGWDSTCGEHFLFATVSGSFSLRK